MAVYAAIGECQMSTLKTEVHPMRVTKGRVSLTTREFEILVSGRTSQAIATPVAEPAKPKFARVPCAYGTCSATFLPNGVGSRQHTTCPKGKAALIAARI